MDLAEPQILHYNPEVVLDYGCGKGTFRNYLMTKGNFKGKFYEYDPAIPSKSRKPRPADVVVCTDVLEHIEPEYLDSVLEELEFLTKKGIFLVIATKPANQILPDGRNAHLIIETPTWWLNKLNKFFIQKGFFIPYIEGGRDLKDSAKRLVLWLERENEYD